MLKHGLRSAFLEGKLNSPTGSRVNKIVSAGDAVAWLQNQFDFEKSKFERSVLHDFTGHILSGGTSGLVVDEIRAAISEYYILGVPTHKAYSVFHQEKIIALPEAENYSLDRISAVYGMLGLEYNLILIQIEKDRIQKAITGGHETGVKQDLSSKQTEKIQRLIATDKKIIALKQRGRESELTSEEFEKSCSRAQTIDLFFRKTHQGRKVSDFKVSEIMAMPLTEFGIMAVEHEGTLQFLPFIENPNPLLVTGTLPGFLAHGFSL